VKIGAGTHKRLADVPFRITSKTTGESVFPSSQALLKALYLGTFEIAKKWTMPIRNWGKVRGELEIMYPDRMQI
jgi:transposase-like protein